MTTLNTIIEEEKKEFYEQFTSNGTIWNRGKIELTLEPITAFLTTAMQRVAKAERADWLRSEIEKLEGMKDDYPVDAQPTTKEHEMRINWANPVAHQALTSIITRYKEELLELDGKEV